MRRTLRRLTEPAVTLTDPADRRRAEFLSWLLLTLIPTGAAGLATRLGAQPWFGNWHAMSSAIGLVLMSLGYVLARTRHFRVGAWLTTFAASASAFAVAIIDDFRPLQIAFMGLSILVAGLVLSVREMLVVAVLNVAAVLFIPLLRQSSAAFDLITPISYLLFLTLIVAMGTRFRDLIERDRASLLQESEQRYRDLFGTAFDGLGVIRDGRVIEVNAGFSDVFDRGSSQLIGMHVVDLVAEDSRNDVARALERDTSTPIEMAALRPDQSVIHVEAVTKTLPRLGSETQFLAVRNITPRKDVEARLSISDRAASVGALAAGVAHEINNPLSFLLTNLTLLRDQLTLDAVHARPDASKALEQAIRGAERVRDIVLDLQTLSRPQEEDGELRPVLLHEVLELATRMAGNEIRHHARLIKDYNDVPPVLGSHARLGQVFMNLFLNAAQAIPEGAPDDNEIRITTRRASGAVQVIVHDTGLGIPAKVLRRVFDPFYTTKADQGGSGLGLSICRSIVTSLGGDIRIDSRMGEGTTVTVTLPAVAELETSTAVGRSGDLEGSGELAELPALPAIPPCRVLIIDDEPYIADSLQRALPDHEVKIAMSGREGLRMCLQESFDVIFCDVMMPEISGLDVYEALARQRPEAVARIVFISGGAFTSRARVFLDGVPNKLLEKPFSLRDLRQSVVEIVLEQHASTHVS